MLEPRFTRIKDVDRWRRMILGLPVYSARGAHTPPPWGYYRSEEDIYLLLPNEDTLRTLYLAVEMCKTCTLADVLRWLKEAGLNVDRRNFYAWARESAPVREIMLPYEQRLACYRAVTEASITPLPEEIEERAKKRRTGQKSKTGFFGQDGKIHYGRERLNYPNVRE